MPLPSTLSILTNCRVEGMRYPSNRGFEGEVIALMSFWADSIEGNSGGAMFESVGEREEKEQEVDDFI